MPLIYVGLVLLFQHLEFEDVKKGGGSQCPLNVPSMSPNNIDSRRICENQKCDDEQFVEQKPLK